MALNTYSGTGQLSYSELDSNWTELDRRTGPGWNDNVMPIYPVTGVNAPDISEWAPGFENCEFRAGQTNATRADFHIKHDWKIGTMQYPHLHFVTHYQETRGGLVRIGYAYTQARRFDDVTGSKQFPDEIVLYVNYIIPTDTPRGHFVAEMPEGYGIPADNINIDSMVPIRIFRDGPNEAAQATLLGTNSFPASIWGLTVDLHYEVDRSSGTPSRTPPFGI